MDDPKSLKFLQKLLTEAFSALQIPDTMALEENTFLVTSGGVWATAGIIEERRKTFGGPRTFSYQGFTVGIIKSHPGLSLGRPDDEPIEVSKHSSAASAAEAMARLWFDSKLEQVMSNIAVQADTEEIQESLG